MRKEERFSILKNKIIPKNIERNNFSDKDKFTIADDVLLSNEEKVERKQVVRKTFSIPEKEVINFNIIKNKALDYRVVLSDSEIVRIGLSLLLNVENREFHEKILNFNKLITGRPKIR